MPVSRKDRDISFQRKQYTQEIESLKRDITILKKNINAKDAQLKKHARILGEKATFSKERIGVSPLINLNHLPATARVGSAFNNLVKNRMGPGRIDERKTVPGLELLIDPAEEAAETLQQVEAEMLRLKQRRILLARYAQELSAALERYRASTRPAGPDKYPARD